MLTAASYYLSCLFALGGNKGFGLEELPHVVFYSSLLLSFL